MADPLLVGAVLRVFLAHVTFSLRTKTLQAAKAREEKIGVPRPKGRTDMIRSPTLLLGAVVALASLNAPAQAEELRIGFLAPMTGIFAQIGKDMVNGFALYLDQHNNKLGGADVKFVVEDTQGKGDAAVEK